MILKDVINEIKKDQVEDKKINIYYYMDIPAGNGNFFYDEFIGVASYHDNFLDTSEDPDGWSLADVVKSYYIYPMSEDDIKNNEISIHVLLETGVWDILK